MHVRTGHLIIVVEFIYECVKEKRKDEITNAKMR
jgi:hypothetical protein